ncbi:MAG: CDP-glycerol glycerophosphotransferase family protein [Clostridiales Family XIII bacterium]|nr:CDP-glycerol glycerophosphotransferase family protein [Clostridiales Family XIII bacterium]
MIPDIENGAASDAVGALYSRFARNAGDEGRDLLNDEEFAEFIRLTVEAVSLIPPARIREARVPEYFKRFLLRLRGEAPANPPPPVVNIRSMMLHRGRLLIEGFFDTDRAGEIENVLEAVGAPPVSAFSDIALREEDPGAEITACAGGAVLPLPDARHYAERRHFGRTLVTYRTFEADIETDALHEGDEIYFITGNAAEGAEAQVESDAADAESGSGAADVKSESGAGKEMKPEAVAAPVRDIEGRRRMVFAEPEAGMSPGLGRLYKVFGDFALEYEPTANAMTVRVPTVSLRLKHESRAFRSLTRAKAPLKKKMLALTLRAAYFITRPYFRRQKIRLYYDRIHAGGDNGRYLFEYSSDRCRAEGGPVGRHRYLASNRSGASIELKRGGYKVHSYESPYRKLIALHAEIIFATYANVKDCIGLSDFEKRWFADLFSAHVVCVQHGLTVRRIPRYRARYIDNTELYFCASEKEADSLRFPAYGYEPSMIRVTGLPRFDGLVSYPENIILIAPARRRMSADPGDYSVRGDSDDSGDDYDGLRDSGKSYNGDDYDGLSDSGKSYNGDDYDVDTQDDGPRRDDSFEAYDGAESLSPNSFDAYRRLLTDEGLLSLFKENGYRLVFLLRPPLSYEAEYFEEYVADPVEMIVSTRADYEQYLHQAAALITDYDDIQYDFAYMEKPVVYYRPPDLPPPYESDAFDYEEMGFGPIVKDTRELTERLTGMMTEWSGEGDGRVRGEDEDQTSEPDGANDASSREVYLKRAREFFKYHDRENRGRIYDEIEKDYGA